MKSLFSLLILTACASAPTELTQKATQLEVYETKPQDCKVVGRVVGIDEEGSKELALNHALNQAADKNATGLFVNEEIPNGNKMAVHATAYRCD